MHKQKSISDGIVIPNIKRRIVIKASNKG